MTHVLCPPSRFLEMFDADSKENGAVTFKTKNITFFSS